MCTALPRIPGLGRLGGLILGLALGGLTWFPSVAQSPSGEEALRRELEKARQEIRQLQEENARLKGERAVSPATVPVPAASAPPAVPAAVAPTSGAVAAVPTITVPAPIPEGAEVSVEQMLADYRTSALAGDARYKGRRVRISGKVHSFKKAFVGLSWTVQLKANDQLGLVRCQVQFPGISDFRPYPPTSILEGRRPFREWQPLLRQGEKAVFEGMCEGIDDAVIVLKDCKPVAP